MATGNPIGTARFKLAHQRPYLASAIWALQPVKKEGLGTLACDKYWRLYWDPAITEKWNIDQLTAVLYHEINHLLRSHHVRGESFDAFQYNMAGDMEINDDIRDEEFSMPGGLLMPETFNFPDHKMAEWYYGELEKQKPPGGWPQVGEVGAGQCGSAANGQGDGEGEDGKPNGQNGGINQTQGELLKKGVAKEVAEASKSRGNVPAHLKRWAEEQLVSKVNWKKELAALVKRAVAQASGSSDYTFKKMSRRSDDEVILPATYEPVPNVSVVIDTSGSMGSKQIEQAMGELDAILRGCGVATGVQVLVVDAHVHSAKRVFSKNAVELAGGGGTDMRLGIEHAIKTNKPDIVIVLTDGYTPWPEERPKAQLIVCLIDVGYGDMAARCPQYARVVTMKDEE